MRIVPEALFVFLLCPLGVRSATAQSAAPAASPTPSPQTAASPAADPSPAPSVSPSPSAKLLTYWYETPVQRSTVPLLRFEDQAEVRALEMNAAIARFFDNSDANGDMTRGAKPGGAPTLDEMKNYRPHMSPSLDFLAIAMAIKNGGLNALKGAYKSRVERNEELLRTLLLRDAAKASPSPDMFAQPLPSPSPSPSPTPR